MKHRALKWAKGIGLSALAALSFGLAANATPVVDKDSDLGRSLNLPITRWHDDTKATEAIIVGVHGMTLYADTFNDLATELANKGFDFYAADLRGFGRWKTDAANFKGDDKIHFGQSEEDLRTLLQSIRANNPQTKIYLLGESLGANIALWLATNHANLVDGVILSAPCFKADMHPSPRWAVDAVRGLAHPNKAMDMTPYITPYLTNDQNVSKACLNDKNICRELSPMDLFKADKTNKEALAKLSQMPGDLPVLVIAGQNDKVMHSSSIAKTVEKFGSNNVSVNIIPNKGHLLLEHQVVDASVNNILLSWLDKTQLSLGAGSRAQEIASKSAAEEAVRQPVEVADLDATEGNLTVALH